ncbi:Tex family protein [Pseudalkalibacillus berkeleyi]|uniref:RNA-binding transcriptional accessory protein n=1 Tax=Pseudalkalibacillus berkeleyi TaxID=1069813 RepID=A0ABS9H6C9_9BACL|nr:Tex family protein [Pseudalkalibacillus berkeleyi]MCF6139343.1 RNA-binding transcriptional accessory protein [Pseudalkalibacillus berkeleyi]
MELNNELIKQIASETKLSIKYVKNIIDLLVEGNTVPFIARYRKEMTGAADEVQIRDVSEAWEYKNNLEKRKEEVLRLIEEQDKLTDELKSDIHKATKLQQVEDLYRPYKQKKRTRATTAKEKGLEPLADLIMEQRKGLNVENEARAFLSDENEVVAVEDAIQGAEDIIAERVSDDSDNRTWIRTLTFQEGMVETKVKSKKVDEEDEKTFEMYYDYQEPIKKIVPHRTLAVNRGEKEGILRVSISAPSDKIIRRLNEKYVVADSSSKMYIERAILDGYKRLVAPSIERDIRNELTEQADAQAIRIFSENLRHLLLQPPLKGKIALGIDPGYRTGCKIAVVDDTGKTLDINVMYPTPPRSDIEKSKEILQKLIEKHGVEIIAIGNGTGSRETEQFVADLIKEQNRSLAYIIVNEAGASVYSASDVARQEFPDMKVEERSAVSIARRLQDPLAELVKIDPKSIGVGQYQHDVAQKQLNDSLTFVVETVVNQVGVNVNTASSSLLQYVAGLSKTVANNVVKQREEEGKFTSRAQLKKIPRLGAKTYEQCIGFLRIMEGKNPLDQTPIHPETYNDTKKLLELLGATTKDIGSEEIKAKLQSLDVAEYASKLDIGELTLKDIIDALVKPSRDPRDEIAKPLLKTDVLKMEDLEEGMELEGTVRNVVDFGAFVDIGVKQDGLVHISKLSNRFVKHPMDVVHVGEVVTVWVDQVDVKKQRIALTMVNH